MSKLKKIKLLFITYTHSNGGGAEKILTTLVNHLDLEKYEVDIQEIYDFHVKKEPIKDEIKLLRALIDNNTETRFSKHFTQYCIEKHPALIRAVKQWDEYDIIITWNYQYPSFFLPAFQDKKTISWFHTDVYDLKSMHISKWDTYNFNLQYAAWKCADNIITISEKSLESVEVLFPEFLSKTEIIYNPIDLLSVQQHAKETVNTDFLVKNMPVIVCVGLIDERKNFSLVLYAAAKLKKDNLCCNVIIVGDGRLKLELITLSEELGIKDTVFFVGYKNNPIPYIQSADILCVSSLAEGFPTVVCEAMCLGKPFVTTPVAGASMELADNGKCGLVADWNCDDYAKKIKLLLNDKESYHQMSQNCVKKIKEFSVERMIECFDCLIASLPEKKQNIVHSINYVSAQKKIKKLYVWCFDFVIQRLRFSLDSFFIQRNIKYLLFTGYYTVRIFFYILTFPVRVFKIPMLLKSNEDEQCSK